jgi:serine-type D-Ala-D-Ala carboxypeptidase
VTTRPVDERVTAAVGRVFPGCVVVARRAGQIVMERAWGTLGYGDLLAAPVTSDTIYDVASLTKAVVTAPLAMRFVQQGRLRLSDRLVDVFPGFDERVTVHHLLTHRAGLPAWKPYYRDFLREQRVAAAPPDVRARFVACFRDEGLVSVPGAGELYSDPGYMLLGWLIEVAGNAPLDALFQRELAAPLGLTARFGPLPAASGVAPTETNDERGVICGAVHDENAFALGGVAGHAGLFATARDVALIGQELLDARRGEGRVLDAAAARAFLDAPRPALPDTRIPGYDTPTPGASSAGTHLGREAFGHLGFTGCSLWCDPGRELVVVHLSNRVHPTREGEGIKAFRPRLHDAIVAWVEGVEGARAPLAPSND